MQTLASLGKVCIERENLLVQRGVVWSNLSYVDLGLRSQEMPQFLQSRELIAGSTVGPHTAQPAPAVAPHDPPPQADACRSALGRPILSPQTTTRSGRGIKAVRLDLHPQVGGEGFACPAFKTGRKLARKIHHDARMVLRGSGYREHLAFEELALRFGGAFDGQIPGGRQSCFGKRTAVLGSALISGTDLLTQAWASQSRRPRTRQGG